MNNKLTRQRHIRENFPLLLIAFPGILCVFLFSYVPMFGVIIAFKDFKYPLGIFGSQWVGIDNFKFLFSSDYIYGVIGRTVGYHMLFEIFSIVCSVLVAVLLYEVNSKLLIKTYQTAILLPSFISFVLISYIVFTLLSHEYGILNNVIEGFGGEAVKWYNEPKYWPAILLITNLWKGLGYSSLLYYATIIGIDTSLFEAAEIDGANKMQLIRHITIPSLVPIVCLMLIMSMGNVMSGNFDLFYQVPRQSAALYGTTDIINTYVYRMLSSGNITTSSAVGFFQSFVGTIMLLLTNTIVRKISPENSMF
ncbi:MAG: sugar ABC transporter permease [Clostridia bacterium]|nr:sugar ABC transporter permease [Clostridia bacterium]